MTSHLFTSKKAQISTEVLYSVGTMIVIFLLLTGITFNRKIEIRKIGEFLDKRSECLKISDAISSTTSSGNGAQISVLVTHNVTVYADSRILVSEPNPTSRTVEAICTFTGNVNASSMEGLAYYNFTNIEGLVRICPGSPNCP